MSNNDPSESHILSHAVQHSYEGFTPVNNATADLDSYEIMSMLKGRKRKRSKENKGPSSWSLPTLLYGRGSNENIQSKSYVYQLQPADIFDEPPSKSPRKRVEMKCIGEKRKVLDLQTSAEWSAGYVPQSPPLTPAQASGFMWKTNAAASSMDLGNIYERKANRAFVRKWLASHQDAINQEDLKHVSQNCNLYVINHVLYSDRMIIRKPWSSGEKKIDAGPISASSKFQNNGPQDLMTIRSKEIGIKPICYKFIPLQVKKTKKGKLELSLARETTQAVLAPKQLFPVQSDTDSQQTLSSASSDESSSPATL